jgi:pyruvate formate lyase activating enzyme
MDDPVRQSGNPAIRQSASRLSRRRFIRNCAIGVGGAVLGFDAFRDFALGRKQSGLSMGFRNDAPAELWKWSREARFYTSTGSLVHCRLCPHQCILGENDRGFCRARVVKGGKLHTLDYGNPCAVHLDPIEKKPFYHFHPTMPILSLATAGCNLRCINCQNWPISQSKPEQTDNEDLMPEQLVALCQEKKIPALAYTYSEPIIYYEYVYDTARLARSKGILNAIVTAGFINPEPLRELLKVIDAVTLDLKAFNEFSYRKITSARLAPVLETIRIIKESGVWLELSNLIVPTLSDDLDDVRRFSNWIVQTIGPDVPLHFLRFHPQYKLLAMPPTATETLEAAREVALKDGVHHVYLGNVPGHAAEHTYCPGCREMLIQRDGFQVTAKRLKDGRCIKCGRPIAGVWG